MLDLKSPRHTSTLPIATGLAETTCLPMSAFHPMPTVNSRLEICREVPLADMLGVGSSSFIDDDFGHIDAPRSKVHHAFFLTARFPGDGQEARNWRAFAAAFRSPRRPFLA
jgi:hypothetical protein